MSPRPIARTSGEPGPDNAFRRMLVLGLSLALLVCLLAAWWFLDSRYSASANQPRQSVLDKSFPDSEFSPEASADDLLALADKTVASLIEAWPSSATAFNIKANRDFLLSDTQAARDAWTKALELDANDADALFGLANLAFEEGDYQE